LKGRFNSGIINIKNDWCPTKFKRIEFFVRDSSLRSGQVRAEGGILITKFKLFNNFSVRKDPQIINRSTGKSKYRHTLIKTKNHMISKTDNLLVSFGS